MEIIINSTITCPKCKNSVNLEMPTDACLFFHKCENCNEILKPLAGDCCVFCSYGTIKCPPVQLNGNCC